MRALLWASEVMKNLGGLVLLGQQVHWSCQLQEQVGGGSSIQVGPVIDCQAWWRPQQAKIGIPTVSMSNRG